MSELKNSFKIDNIQELNDLLDDLKVTLHKISSFDPDIKNINSGSEKSYNQSPDLQKTPVTHFATRERIMMQLLESKKFIFNLPLDVITTCSIICYYVETGQLPITKGEQGQLLVEEVVEKLAKEVFQKSKNTSTSDNHPINTANKERPSNNGFFKKVFGIF